MRRIPLPVLLYFVVVFAVGCVYVFSKGTKRSAFNRWQPQIVALSSGLDIYTQYGYPNPPIMAMILLPFVTLPAPLGMVAWFALKSVFFLWATRMMLAAVEHSGATLTPRQSNAAMTWAWICSATPVIADLMHGNINLWILFLVVAGLRAHQHRHDGLAGLLFSLAAACKVTPVLLLMFFAWKRQWKLLVSSALGFVLWLLILPSMWLGVEQNGRLLVRWSDLMLRPYLADGRVETDVRNQSLAGLFHRVFTHVETSQEGPGNFSARVRLARWNPQQARWVWRAVVVASLVFLCLIIRPAGDDRTSLRTQHEFCLILLAMLLLSERSWKHHFVTLLPSYVVILALVMRSPCLRMLMVSLVAGSVTLMNLASADLVEPIFGPATVDFLQAFGPYTWATLLVIVVHVVWLRKCRAVAPAEIRTPNA